MATNIKNLKRAFNHVLLNVNETMFDMGHYRKGDFGCGFIIDKTPHECNTVGCIIGHCTVLDTIDNFYECLDFTEWTRSFFVISEFSDEGLFLFSSYWSDNIQSSTKEQALLRLAYFIDFQKLPDGFWKPSCNGMDKAHNYQLVMPYRELKPYIITQ